MKDNDKFLKPGTVKELPRTTTDNAGMASVKPLPVKPGKPKGVQIVPNAQLPMPAGKPKVVADPRVEAVRKMQVNR